VGVPPPAGVGFEPQGIFDLVDHIAQPAGEVLLLSQQLHIQHRRAGTFGMQARQGMHHETGFAGLTRGQCQADLIFASAVDNCWPAGRSV